MFFPVMIEIENKDILIVGAGKVAYRKAQTLLEFGAKLTILSPEKRDEFKVLENTYNNRLSFIYNRYDVKYIEDKFMVIAATSDKNVNKKIAEDCRENGVLVNSVDGREDSDFINTSIIKNDNLTISISTSGSFPYLSKKIRTDIEREYKKYDREYMNILEDIRYIILEKHPTNWREVMDNALSLNIEELKIFKEKLDNK